MSADRCTCKGLKPGLTYAELRGIKSCQDRWICGELVKARKLAEKREATGRRIAALTGGGTDG